MGMFDSMYDANGGEWQTKALACLLNRYEIGEPIPGPPIDYQMAVFGEPEPLMFVDSFATVSAGFLAALPTERDESLPLLDYSGGWTGGWLTGGTS